MESADCPILDAAESMNSLAFLLLRLTFGLGLAWHGFQSLFLIESGISGLAGMIEAQGWPVPMAMAYLAKLTELLCGLMVALGLFTRWAAFGCAFVMGTAIYMTGDLMAFGAWELAFLYCAAFLALLLAGAGNISIDSLRARNAKRAASATLEESDADEMEDPTTVVDSLGHRSPRHQAPTGSGPAPPEAPQAPIHELFEAPPQKNFKKGSQEAN